MKIRQLEYLCAIAEENSISAAARKLNVAQPPISRQMDLLESELGVQLFIRGNKGMTLTEAGESLYQQSMQVINQLDHIAENVRELGTGISGTLKIGIIYSTIPYAIPYIRSYHNEYPHIELNIRLGSPQDLIEDLNSGDLNVLFLRSGSVSLAGLHEQVLGEDALELIMMKSTDPAPGFDEVPVDLLQDAPMCLLRSDDLWRYDESLLRRCYRSNVSPKIICHCYDTPMAMQMVRSGFGISFLPRSIVDTQPGSGIYSKKILGFSATSRSVLVWNENAYRSKAAQLFTEGSKAFNYMKTVSRNS